MAEQMYQAQDDAGPGASDSPAGGDAPAGDDVVDAEFEEVKDKKDD